MASDFSVALQFSEIEQLLFVTDQTPRPYLALSLPAQLAG
jgi:hypothetical protein